MRILQANSFHYRRGGDSVQFLELADALGERGHDVGMFSMHHSGNLPSRWSPYWVANVEYRGELSSADRLRAAWRSVYSPSVGRHMTSLVRDFGPDVVHFHSVQHHLTVAAVDACLALGVPTVWTLHDYRSVCPATSLLRAGELCDRCAGGQFWHGVVGRCKSGELTRSAAAVGESYITRMRGTLKAVDCFIAPSRFLAGKVVAMGLPARRVEVIPNPVAVYDDAPKGRRESAEILYVGRLSPEKGAKTLIRAVAKVPGVRLRVVGDGPEHAVLKTLAQESKACVSFDGWLDADGVRERMRDARLLCVPSVWYENCPGVVLEGMALGLPVVASDLGGLTELLDSGRAGWLAPPGDVAAWSAVLSDALTRPEDGEELARAALARVRARHSPGVFLDTIEAVYRSLIDCSTRPPAARSSRC